MTYVLLFLVAALMAFFIECYRAHKLLAGLTLVASVGVMYFFGGLAACIMNFGACAGLMVSVIRQELAENEALEAKRRNASLSRQPPGIRPYIPPPAPGFDGPVLHGYGLKKKEPPPDLSEEDIWKSFD